MFEGSKNDTSINPRCWVAMNFKQSISYALLQIAGKSTYYRRRLKLHLQKIRSSVRPMYVGGSIDGYLMKEAYRDMASALSKADGIDYTDPEELELLVATIMDLNAMDGKGSVSLLAECSTSPDVNTRGSSVCSGDCPPDAILRHEECNKANKIAYYSELHNI
ncbi:uncharacterized protein LOC111920398 isoform X2 [Lactuca sativa]|uniref:uncharacterized protein LOC111920398 isoform X2 n=1 Tax=Lactuca sativa TaxID=4236 RepID=UPI000CD863B9|nr:uncharacterized protein LOC111920398 isoform X2 [Lactuca sativa]